MKVNVFQVCMTVCLAIAANGCGFRDSGYSSTHLEGDVTVAGQPLAEGSVQFIPQGKGQGPTVGGMITDGRYAVDGVPLGSVRVVFISVRKTHRIPADGIRPERWATENLIPQKHCNGIVIEVTEGQYKQDFML